MVNDRILVTGTRSGLGFAVNELLQGIELYRGKDIVSVLTPHDEPYDAIIHCAANTNKTILLNDVYDYLRDNLLLTQQLLRIPHKKFIYISTVGFYPATSDINYADSNYDVSNINGLYNSNKLFSEALAKELGKNALVIRPSNLLGSNMRPNTTYNILTKKNTDVFLSGNSKLNYVLNNDIANFIKLSIEQNICGIFNLASINNITLNDLVERYGLNVTFGGHYYDVGILDTKPAINLCDLFNKTSIETLDIFINELGDRFIGKKS